MVKEAVVTGTEELQF